MLNKSSLWSMTLRSLLRGSAVGRSSRQTKQPAVERLEDRLVPTIYNVGPGQAYTTIGAVPWNNLQAGDVVDINWQATAYHEKIILSNSGTASQPITINGIPNAQGQLPILDGSNATTSANMPVLGYTPLQDYGEIIIYRNKNQASSYNPSNININNLQIQGAIGGTSYTGYGNTSRTYIVGAGGIWTEGVVNLTIHGCVVTNNDNGVFASVDGSTGAYTTNITLDSNYLYGNGVAGSDRFHESYIEADGAVYQYNDYGPERSGAIGNALKDRSAGTVIRYNYFLDGGHLLDLVDAEDSPTGLALLPSYLTTFVYGNILVSDANGPSQLIHYGGDSGNNDYRNGTLYFYDNTVISQADQSTRWRTNMFELDGIASQQLVDVRNNIFYNAPQHSGVNATLFEFSISQGNINFGSNWVSPGWLPSYSAEMGQSYDGTISGTNNFFVDPNNNPSFANLATYDVHLLAGSNAIGLGGALASAAASNYPVTNQYVYNQGSQARTSISDLGAFNYAATVSVTGVTPISGLTSGGQSVTITGTGFTGATGVAFGGVAAKSFTINSGTSITAVTPAQAAGTVDVTVAISGGSSATSTADQFQYVVVNGSAAPTVAKPASATLAGNQASAALSVLGASQYPASTLTYTWATTGTPPAPVVFSSNGNNSASNVTATFSKIGSYSFQVTIIDPAGKSVSSNVNVTVSQVAVTLTVSPGSGTVIPNGTLQFSDSATDQFGNPYTATVSWAVSGGGTIDNTGKFTAGSASGGPFTVTDSAGSLNDTASVTISSNVNLAPNGTAYRWFGLSSATANANRTAAPGLNDNNLTADVALTGGGDDVANAYEAGGVVWSTSQSVNKITFTNGSFNAGSYDGVFDNNFTLQTTSDGTTWVTVSGWSVSPAYPYDVPAAAGVTYTFTGSSLSVLGVRVVGEVHSLSGNDSWFDNATEVQAFGTGTSNPPPTVASLNPGSGGLAGGLSVTITGSNFTGATGVSFGGVAASSFTVNSATQITAVDPAVSAAGSVDVTVTTGNGTSATSAADKFTYVSPPSISTQPVSLTVTAGQSASFTVSATGTGTLTYQWQKLVNGAWTNINGATASTFTIAAAAMTDAGSYWVIVGNTGGSVTSNTATLTVNPAIASNFVVTGFTSPATAGVAGSITVTAKDANGNVATGYRGTVHLTSNDAQAVLPANYTFVAGDAGVHTFTVTLKTAGSDSVTATDTVTGAITGSQSGITVSPASASLFVAAGLASPATAGTAGSITVTAKDPYGNVATGYRGTVHFTSSDAQAALPTNYTFGAGDAGTHVFSVTLKTAGTQSLTATDTSTGSITGSQTGITVELAPPPSLTLSGVAKLFPDTSTTYTLTVTPHAANGDTITGITIFWGDGTQQSVAVAGGTFTHKYPRLSAVFSIKGAISDATRSVSSANSVTVTSLMSSPSEGFVAQVYHDVLLRDVDNSGLAGWSGQIDGGQLSRAQAVSAIENSVEAHTLLVQHYYQAYLGRPADPSGLATFVNALGAGTTDEQVLALLLGSPEYLQRNGNTTSGFLDALYLNVLGRQIDPSGDATFTAQLNAGVSRQTVALEILTSKEYYTRLVNQAYQTYLHRAADGPGLANWEAALQNGSVTDQGFLANLIGSQEYLHNIPT